MGQNYVEGKDSGIILKLMYSVNPIQMDANMSSWNVDISSDR